MIIAGRIWAAATGLVAALAVLLELVLVIIGAAGSVDEPLAPLGIRLWRLVSYFTIQSNVLVIITVLPLIMDPAHDGPRWRVLRMDGVVMIMVTGLVHWFLLRPLLTLTGWPAVSDTLLHIVVPLLAVVGWLVFGPRPRITPSTVAWSLVWPLSWLVYTLVVGALTGWYPYDFLNAALSSGADVALTCGAIFLLFVGLASACWRLDRVLARRPPASEVDDTVGGG